jgi:catechol 2,3-dioxygenase-like lactoylglutathione lyase family enzyme
MTLWRLDHVLVLTDDLEATRAFYCDVLGLRIGDRPEAPFAGYWLYLDDRVVVHVADREEYAASASQFGLAAANEPVDHLAFRADDYEELAQRVASAGLDATTNTVPGVMRQLFVFDPNGVRIELNVAD